MTIDTYTLLHRYEHAERLEMIVLSSCIATLPAGHSYVYWATVQLAEVKLHQGHLILAEGFLPLLSRVSMGWKAWQGAIRVAMVKLAVIYYDQGRVAEMNKLVLHVILSELNIHSFPKHIMPKRITMLSHVIQA